MTRDRHQLRKTWVALAAIVGALLAMGETPARAATAEGRMAQMRKAGCCCPEVPAGGCCCEPDAATGPSGASVARPLAVAATPMIDPARRGDSCQCRSSDAPAPAPRPDRGGTEGRAQQECVAIGPETIDDLGVPAPTGRPSATMARPPKVPLYLRTTRLLI